VLYGTWDINHTTIAGQVRALLADYIAGDAPQLKREGDTKSLLLSRGFHWVQEYPFIR
jgi:hypothetical protein